MNEQIALQEAELLRQAGQGSREAFAQLYDQFSGALHGMAARILNDPKEAEDVLQEVFLQIWDRAAQFDPRLGRPFNWAMTLTRNKAIDRLRASQRRFRLAEAASEESNLELASAEARGAEAMAGAERAAVIRQVMAGLPAEQRQAIEMAFFRGMSQTEIAEALRQPLGTIKARIRRGMLRLRETLEKGSADFVLD